MKNKPLIITLIVVLVVISVSLIGLMIKLLNGETFFSFNYKLSNTLIVDETYDNTLENLKIDTEMGDVEIKESLDEKVRLVIYGNEELTTYDFSNGTLDIKTRSKSCIGICFNRVGAKVEISIPKNYSKTIDLISKYGDIEIGEFINANITIENDAGDTVIDGGNIIKISSHYGDVTVKESNDLEIDNDCGDITIDSTKNAKLENHLGDIEVGEITSYTKIIADCGDIKIDKLELTENSTIENNMGDVEIGKTNEIYIDAKTSLGDTEIKNNYREAKIELKIDNSCGDIIVKN